MPDVLGTLKTPRLAFAPSAPVVGQMYYDTGTNLLNYWNGTAWVASGGSGVSDPLKVDKDSIVTGATRIVANKMAVGDPNPTFQINGVGTLAWGPSGGATTLDVTLKRSGVGLLQSSGTVQAVSDLVGRASQATQVTVGAVGANAGLLFGSAADTNLYRSAAASLKTDGSFIAGPAPITTPTISVVGLGSSPTSIEFGNPNGNFRSTLGSIYSTGQTFIALLGRPGTTEGTFRADAIKSAILQTDGAGGLLLGTVPAVAVDNQPFEQHFKLDATDKISFGTAADTNLYRLGAGLLKSDGYVFLGQSMMARQGAVEQVAIGALSTMIGGGPGGAGIAFGSTGDAYISRPFAGALLTNAWILGSYVNATDNALSVYKSTDPNPRFTLNASGRMQWSDGTAAVDVTLQRSAAFTLNLAGQFRGNSDLIARDGSNQQVFLGSTTGGGTSGLPGITFGTGAGADTNLYRVGATWLATDSAFWVKQNRAGAAAVIVDQLAADGAAFLIKRASDTGFRWRVNADSSLQWGPGDNTWDTNLYRSGGTLKTDAGFASNQTIFANNNDATKYVFVGYAGGAQNPGFTFGNFEEALYYDRPANGMRFGKVINAPGANLSYSTGLYFSGGPNGIRYYGILMGAFTLPGSSSSCAGSLRVDIDGTAYKIPYYT